MTALSKAAGVEFIYNTEVKELVSDGGKISGIRTAENVILDADLVILCAAFATSFFKKVKSNLVMAPMRGASIELHGCSHPDGLINKNMADYTRTGFTKN